jgi:hypothetical protein
MHRQRLAPRPIHGDSAPPVTHVTRCTRVDLLFTMSDSLRALRQKSRARELMLSRTSFFELRRSKAGDASGGARRDRTDDLLLAKQALSQLSYGPAPVSSEPHRLSAFAEASADNFTVRRQACRPQRLLPQRLVGLGRLELPTSRLSSARSNQLSYKPAVQGSVIRDQQSADASIRYLIPDDRSLAWARSRRKRNEDGGVPLIGKPILKPICPDVSKRSDRERVRRL